MFRSIEEMWTIHRVAAKRRREFPLPTFDVKGLPLLFYSMVPNIIGSDATDFVIPHHVPYNHVPACMRDMGALYREFNKWASSGKKSVRTVRTRGR